MHTLKLPLEAIVFVAPRIVSRIDCFSHPYLAHMHSHSHPTAFRLAAKHMSQASGWGEKEELGRERQRQKEGLL